MNIKQQYKRFKEWQIHTFDWSFDKNKLHHCVNCDNVFVGNYCPYCSQKAGVKNISWKSVLQSTAEVWGMGNRSMLYSLWQLIWRPGYFISDYINGKRQVSFPPVKMLVVMGVISVLIDHLCGINEFKTIQGDKSLVAHFFAWLKSSPGWGWFIMTGFFMIPTWCLFHYAPRNTRHTLPQGFFITVFMAIQVLIVECLADFFGYYTFLLIPLCYFYTYRQLFGYGYWGNFWRVVITLGSGFWLVILAMSIAELLTKSSKLHVSDFVFLIFHTIVPILVGIYISKITFKRREKKDTQNLEISVNDQTEDNPQTEDNDQTENNDQTEDNDQTKNKTL